MDEGNSHLRNNLLNQLLDGVQIITRNEKPLIEIDPGVLDLIEANPNLLGPEVGADLLRRQNETDDDVRQMQLRALHQIFHVCSKPGGMDSLRSQRNTLAAEGMGSREQDDVLDTAEVNAFFKVCGLLQRRFEKTERGVLWGALSVAIGSILRELPASDATVAATLQDHAISALEAGCSALWTRTQQPDIGIVLFELGTLWLFRAEDRDRANSLEQAVDCLKAALNVISRATNPQSWAMANASLGAAYFGRTTGDRRESVELALKCFENALTVVTQEGNARKWANIKNSLGLTYLHRVGGHASENLELAIQHFGTALDAHRSIADQAGCAITYHNLGIAYHNRIQGIRAENLEVAIKNFQTAVSLFDRIPDPQHSTEALIGLGGVYIDRLKGDRAENLEQAITCCEQVVTNEMRELGPDNWASAHNVLGIAYKDRKRGNRAENMERAIACYEAALTVHTRSLEPHKWAAIRNNLGDAYYNRPRGDRAENLERAITCYEDALTTADTDPEAWAWTCMNLGQAYKSRILGEPAENIEKSIDYLERALTIHTRHNNPTKWATILYYLGIAFRTRVEGDSGENLERAITCFEGSLTVREQHGDLPGWAAACTAIGNAYTRRLVGDREHNIERAIAYHEQALSVVAKATDPHFWGLINDNLGSAYRRRRKGDRTEYLKRAITCYEAACEGLTRESDPYAWAHIRSNMGNAYSECVDESPVENLKAAIACYQDCLQMLTKETDPHSWAMTTNNLGNAYFYLSQYTSERKANLRHAISHWRAALPLHEVIAPDVTLGSRVLTGDALFEMGDMLGAANEWNLALAQREGLLRKNIRFETRADTTRHGSRIAAQLAAVELLQHNVSSAITILERGRAIALREALALDDVWLSELPELIRAQIISARERLANLRSAPVTAKDNTTPSQLANWERSIAAAETDLQDLLNSVKFVPLPPMEAPAIAALAPSGGALVYLVAGSKQGAAIILPSGCDVPGDDHVVMLPEATYAAMREAVMIWLEAYNLIPRGAPSFADLLAALEGPNSVLEGILDRLWAIVMGPVLARAAQLGVTRGGELVLMPQGDLALLPLHAAKYVLGGVQRVVLDDYVISYVPSAALLRTARQRLAALPPDHTNLFAVFNPMRCTRDALPLSEQFELPPLRDLFGAKAQIFAGADATTGRVIAEASNAAYIHFACHGHFDPSNPEQSGLQLAGNERLTVQMIVQELKLRVNRWVTLSACETAMVDVQHIPDEFIGLPAAFLQAGSVGVMATLWSVYDHSSARLIPRLYRQHVETGAAPAAALREAVLWLRGSGDYAFDSQLTAAKSEANTDSAEPAAAPRSTAADLFSLPIVWAAYSYHGV